MDVRSGRPGNVLLLVSAFSGTFVALLDLTIVNVAGPRRRSSFPARCRWSGRPCLTRGPALG
ncbi:hypothetical protein ABT120_28930 [Nonomuraea angiospora]|uniref:hypothetical protein n=1 Tax=Nonomuraea angiospora TaxID=46172 RepID=UPI00331FB47E